MDEKDRRIVTFENDDADIASEYENISLDVEIPQAKPADTDSHEQSADSSFQDVSDSSAPEQISSSEQEQSVSEQEPDVYSNYRAERMSRYEPQSENIGQIEDPAPAREVYRSRASVSPVQPARERKYVTKGTLVICMVITMFVSSILGAFLGGALSGGSGSSSPDDNRAPREDSELSQLSLSDATGSSMTVAEVVDKNADAVVEILVSGTTQDYFGQLQVTEGAGSGVIVTSNGYIVTNYHVIQGANKVQVTLHNGETYPAAIVGGVDENDIAVIKINANNLTVAEIGDSSKVKVGDTAVAIGNPLGQLGGTATTGIISALDRTLTIEGRTMTLMQTDAAINGGNSGGGLFNNKGELIGIVDAKSSGVGIEGLAFAIPINTVSDIINDLIENGKVTTRPVVGITIQDVSEANAETYNLEAAGVYIAQVTGENAQKAGFEQGDRIISIDGKDVKDSQTFIAEVRKHKVGDTVSIVVSRQGQEIEIKTVLEELTTTE